MPGPLRLAAVFLLVAACADVPPAAPELVSVSPSSARSLQAVTLTIAGAHLNPRPHTDFNDGGGAMGADLTLALRGPAGDLPLTITEHASPERIVARLATGAPAGHYDLVATDPWGRTAELANALWLLGPCESTTGPNPGDPCDGADSDQCTDDVYGCEAGVLVCGLGADNAELCDGIDNDCNPATEDGADEPTLRTACDGSDADRCTDDVQQCVGGVLSCSSGSDNAELCDGIDNDCDPSTVDGAGDPAVGQGCDGPDSDLCTDDARICAGGNLACSTGADNAEVCDGVDNDCNPATADGAQDPALGQLCDGPDTDLCTDDTRLCSGGALACSSGANNAELCDGVDNDCNPATADGAQDPALGQFCDGPDTDLCTDDQRICGSGGAMVCPTGTDNVELCDGVDNDCNASTVDGSGDPGVGQLCDGADSDLCNDDTKYCNAGAFACTTGAANPELCDGIDNDCNPATGDGASEPTLGQACDGADLDSCLEGGIACSGGALGCNDPTDDFCGVLMKVGTFTKSTSTTVPVTQTITHGMGATPKLLILWSSGGTDTTPIASQRLSVGFVDEARTARVHACASEDGYGISSTARRFANAAVSTIGGDGSLYVEGYVSSWTTTSFNVTWTTNDTNTRQIHYLAIAGPTVRSKLLGYAMRTAIGTQAITGAGFAPAAVLQLHSGTQMSGAPPSTIGGAIIGLSATDRVFQWMTSFATGDGWDVTTARRAQRTDRTFFTYDTTGVLYKQATMQSVDADGFTLNYLDGAGAAAQVSALAIAGVRTKAFCFNKPTVTGAQAVTGIGFRPQAVLFTTFQRDAITSPAVHSAMGLGASDGTTHASTATIDLDGQGITQVARADRISAYLEVQADGSITAEANLTSLNPDGFSLNWFTNDASVTQVCGLAFGPP